MKSSKNIIIAVIVIILIIVGIIIYSKHGSAPSTTQTDNVTAPTDVAKDGAPVAVSETTKVSSTLSEYQNAELGFSVKYPSAWEKEESNAGVTFVIPVDNSQVTTVATLEANVQAFSGTCAFPPVTTVQSRGTIKVGTDTLNMIAMSNTVQGRVYTNRMYSLQQGKVCYMFSFASISLDPSAKGLTGSNVIQAQNNNKAITTSADSDFTTMVKSFAIISTPAGQDETTASPTKK